MTRHNWLITGTSRGFGYEFAKTALAAGDNVLATARRPEQLAEFTDKYGDQVRTVALDVTDTDAAQAAVAAAVGAFGSLDVVANNAGYLPTASPLHVTGGRPCLAPAAGKPSFSPQQPYPEPCEASGLDAEDNHGRA